MNIRQLSSGSWQVSVMVNNRRRSATAASKSEAKRLGAEMLLELGGSSIVRDATVGELLDAWHKSATLSHTFRCDARRIIDRLPPEFTDRKATAVTPAVIEGLYRQLARDAWSVHRIRRAHAVMSTAWTLGRRWEWVHDNPFAAARRPPAPRRNIRPASIEDVQKIIAAATGPLRLYLLLASAIGARRGEMVGLQWADIVPSGIVIRRSLAYAPDSGVVITEGKTGSMGHRVVAIDQVLEHELKAHRREQVEKALAAGLPSPVWIFSHDAGVTPWRPDYVDREFRRTIRPKAGVSSDVRLHDLRHFVATELLGAGVPLKVVSERLGHRQMSTTADVYGHYVPAADAEAARIMAARRIAT